MRQSDVTSIAVIDHGAGNLVSMEQALVRSGAHPTRVDDARDLSPFDGVILPGVGATGAAMRTLRRADLVGPLKAYAGPFLGVCVGMQLLFEYSEEDDTTCLGLMDGHIGRLTASPLPHMGWNDVDDCTDPLVPPGADTTFYFVHSFAPRPDDPSIVTGWTSHGTDRFASIVRFGNVAGVQFHPERSSDAGRAVLNSFVRSCREAAHAA